MCKKIQYSFYLVIQLFLVEYGFAAHIVGGELSYKCLGNNNYRVTLKLYRDCNSTGAKYDDPTTLTIFNKSGAVVKTVDITFPGSKAIPNKTYNLCLTAPSNICVEEAVFSATVYLPPVAGGYTIVYQRCCRNNSILNIWNPESTGASYVATIPDSSLTTCNSSPMFTKFPPTVICVNSELQFDHAATDDDGDSLAYSFFNPFAGGSTSIVYPVPAAAPPFPLVNFKGYTFSNPIGGTVPLTLDGKTGFLSGTPNTIGQFVVGVCVKEYRKGALLSTHYRDFQFNVVQCKDPTADLSLSTTKAPTQTTTPYFPACKGAPVTFQNLSTGGSSYLWDFGVPGNKDTSREFSPTYAYQTTGNFTVTLKVNPGLSCETIATTIVTIYPRPDAISGNNGPVCSGDTVKLTANFVLGGSYSWKGPNGFISTLQFPFIPHSVGADSGDYSLSITLNGCNSPTDATKVVINPIPVVTASTSGPACIGRSVQLFATSFPSAKYSWRNSKGFTSSLQNPFITNITSDDADLYTVTISAKGCPGSPSSTKVDVFSIPDPPVIYNNTPLCSGATLQLSADNVLGGLFHWTGPNNFSSDVQSPAIPNIVFADSGLYQATVTVNGCPSSPSSTEAVIHFAPTSTFTITPPVICPDQDVTIEYTGNGNVGANFEWDFGRGTGGNQGMGPHTVHFINPGTEIITLTTKASKCAPTVFGLPLLVDSLPAVDFSVNDLGCAPFPAQFNNLTRNGNTYEWRMGDGDTSQAVNPLHIYSPGTYTVQLIAKGINSCMDSTMKPELIHVIPNPVAAFSSYPPLTRAYELSEAEYMFTNQSSYSTGYTWYFGDGDSTDLISPEHRYTDSGRFKITLVAHNDIGCTDTLDTNVIAIVPNVNYYIPNAFSPNHDGVNDEFLVYGLSLSTVHLQIFDRTGEKVFESETLQNGWDGKYKNQPATTGVYVYTAVIKTMTGKSISKKGDLLLLR